MSKGNSQGKGPPDEALKKEISKVEAVLQSAAIFGESRGPARIIEVEPQFQMTTSAKSNPGIDRTVQPTIQPTTTTSANPGAIRTTDPSIETTTTTSATPGVDHTTEPSIETVTTTSSTPGLIRTASPNLTGDFTSQGDPGVTRTAEPDFDGDSTTTTTPEKEDGGFLFGEGVIKIGSFSIISYEIMPNINTDAYGETASVEYVTGQDIFADSDINPHLALGYGGFEDGTLSNELSSGYERGSIDWYGISQTTDNGEEVYSTKNSSEIRMNVTSSITYDSVAIVDGSSIGSGAVVAWADVGERTTSSDVSFAADDFVVLSGYEDFSLHMNELVVHTLIGNAGWSGAPTSTITPHMTLFNEDPGQSGNTGEITSARETVTDWTDVGQKNERHCWENTNSITFNISSSSVEATHLGIYDGDQGSGTQLIAGSLGGSIPSDSNDQITFGPGRIRIGAG